MNPKDIKVEYIILSDIEVKLLLARQKQKVARQKLQAAIYNKVIL